MLVMIGATPEGKKELLGFQVRESSQSWHELLVDLKARGLRIAPELAVADGALEGARRGLPRDTPSALLVSQNRQCSQQGGEIHPGQAGPAGNLDGRKAAERALDIFENKYGAKYSGTA
jgi:putative transposase